MLGFLRKHPWRCFYSVLFLGGVACGGILLYQHYRAGHLRQAASELIAKDEFESALPLLRAVADFSPTDPDLLLLLARTARQADQVGEFKESLNWLDLYKKQGGTPEAAERERRYLRAQQGYVDEFSRDLLLSGPERELAYEAFCRGLVFKDRVSEADYFLNEWLKLNPDRTLALVLRAEVLLKHNRTEAKLHLDKALAINPDHFRAQHLLAIYYLVTADPKSAESILRRLSEKKPRDAALLLALASANIECGNLDEAEASLDQVAKLNPRLANTSLLRGKIALARGQGALAEKHLSKLLEGSSRNDIEFIHAYLESLRLQNKTAAMTTWQERLDLLKEGAKAITQLRKKLIDHPEDRDVRFELGAAYLKMAQENEGVFWLQAALAKAPRHEGALRLLAKHFRDHNLPEKALQLERTPGSAKVP